MSEEKELAALSAETAAIYTVLSALMPLSTDARDRVLIYASEWHERRCKELEAVKLGEQNDQPR